MSTELGIGKLIASPQSRDAIHIPVIPMTAVERLAPGQPVTLASEYEIRAATSSDTPIGIVDPFLRTAVFKGERCWLFLYPNTVTSLRHEWEHPAFAKSVDHSSARNFTSEQIEAAKERMRVLAHQVGDSYEYLIQGGKDYIEKGEEICFGSESGPEAMYNDTTRMRYWDDFEIITGIRASMEQKEDTPFRCAC